MVQIQKKKKKECRPGLDKKTLQKIFFISVVTIAREMPKIIKGKNPDRMCLLIFLKIYPQQQKQWHKNSLYIYWECQIIYSNSYLKLQNTHLLPLFFDMYIFSKNHDFPRLK